MEWVSESRCYKWWTPPLFVISLVQNILAFWTTDPTPLLHHKWCLIFATFPPLLLHPKYALLGNSPVAITVVIVSHIFMYFTQTSSHLVSVIMHWWDHSKEKWHCLCMCHSGVQGSACEQTLILILRNKRCMPQPIYPCGKISLYPLNRKLSGQNISPASARQCTAICRPFYEHKFILFFQKNATYLSTYPPTYPPTHLPTYLPIYLQSL